MKHEVGGIGAMFKTYSVKFVENFIDDFLEDEEDKVEKIMESIHDSLVWHY